MRRTTLVIVGVVVVTTSIVTGVRIRRLNREAEQAAPEQGTPRSYIQHSDWDFEVEISAYPSFRPISFKAPTTAPTRPAGDGWAVPVGTRIVLRDEEDRRLVVALRRLPTATAGDDRAAVARVLAELATEVGMKRTNEIGERRMGEGRGVQYWYETGDYVGTATIGVQRGRVIVVLCTAPYPEEFRSARRTFERTVESVRLK